MGVNFDTRGPGVKTGAKYEWKEITAALEANPGKWAIVEAPGTKRTKTAAMGTARRIRDGVATGKPGQFESTVRQDVVYARFVGPDPSIYADD